ncbi:MAG: pantetheine-phosphate adenylyltransferase [Omnitrophica bacterium RBG_13_46_9]|nr:MAG: pantetheine-phosphate adenylyltransferase [Omnitrophica bacterium RBG_13_46_9]
MNRKAIYPGTFDPVTYGHIDIIERASKLYDRVFVGVAHSHEKGPLFTMEERVEMLKKATAHLENVLVEDFDGLVIEYAKEKETRVIIRGLRMISDFEFEFQMALTNKKLSEDIETIFMMTKENFAYLSSKLIKETVSLGADVTSFVPSFVAEKLREKLSVKSGNKPALRRKKPPLK